MPRRTILTLFLLAVLTSSWSVISVHAASVAYTINDEKVTVALDLNFYQNATAMPELGGTFTGSLGQELSSALEEGLNARVGDVSISSLTGQWTVSKDWVNSTIRFEITGVSSREGDLLAFNCSWISFNVTRDLKLGNVSYNKIGATYIRPVFDAYVDFDKPPMNETISDVTYLSDEVGVLPAVALDKAGNATLLDFGRIVSPIDQWAKTYNVTEGSTSWSYSPVAAVDLVMSVTPREGTSFMNRAFYQYNTTISVNGIAHAQGNLITVQGAGGVDPLLMLAVIIVAFVVAAVSSWSYRSRRRQMPRRRK